MELNGWGFALIALYLVVRHGYKYLLLWKLGAAIKRFKGAAERDGTEV